MIRRPPRSTRCTTHSFPTRRSSDLVLRVILALVAISILKINSILNLIGCGLIIVSLLLDALDGYLARRSNTASIPGGIYDILADRIIENVFFIYFACQSLFNYWFAFVILIRGLTADAVRTVFSHTGKTAFGPKTLHSKWWCKVLACSRFSRGLYNTSKLLTFTLYGLLSFPESFIFSYIDKNFIVLWAQVSLWLCVIVALLRTFPVIYELKQAKCL